MGWGKLSLRCDQENSIVDLQRTIMQGKAAQTVAEDHQTLPEHSSVCDHQANGSRTRVQSMMPALKDRIEYDLKTKVNTGYCIMS